MHNRSIKNSRSRIAQHPSAGLTLVELLTVIAIIGLLVAMLLPAVQAAREAARRQQCQNNLRQIALSVINYTDSRQGKLPSLWYTDRAEPWENFAWRASVLPFLDSSPLFDSLDFDQPPLSPANREGVATLIRTFQCPSTPAVQRPIQSLGTPSFGYDNLLIGASDYTAVHDVAIQDAINPAPAAWRSMTVDEDEAQIPGEVRTDVLNPYVRTIPAQLKAIGDGLSQTVLVVEQAGKPLKYGRTRSAERVLPTEGAWATAEFSSFYAGGINEDNLSGLYGFHAGAVVAMCDGSVHFFTENMELEVLTALLSRDGDEIISDADWQ